MKVCLLICPKGNDSDNLKKIAVSVDTDKRLTL